MKITGQILKENRERKGISISEVALATKINNKMIIAMEEGDLEHLPPKTFLRGFVRAYASFLEMDVENLLNTFYDEMGTTKPKTAATPDGAAGIERVKTNPGEADEAINPTTSTAVKIGAVTGILLLVVLIVFFKNKMESYEKETVVGGLPAGIVSLPTPTPTGSPSDTAGALPPGTTPTPDPMAPTPSPTPSDSNTSAAVAPVASPTPTPSPAPTPTPAASATPHATPHVTPSPTPRASATPKPTATPTPTPTPTPKPSPSASPTPTASPVATGRAQEVIIEALDSVDVEAQVDGEAAKKMRLKTDQVQSIKARRKVILRFSDGGAVNLIVNGTERGVPGDLGKPLRIELP